MRCKQCEASGARKNETRHIRARTWDACVGDRKRYVMIDGEEILYIGTKGSTAEFCEDRFFPIHFIHVRASRRNVVSIEMRIQLLSFL